MGGGGGEERAGGEDVVSRESRFVNLRGAVVLEVISCHFLGMF